MKLIELCPVTKLQRQKLQKNYQILKQEVEKFGKDYQKKSYEKISEFPDQDVIIKSVNNSLISCSIEVYHLQKDGTIAVSIDAYGLPTMFGIKPSYHFYKRLDGSVHY